MSTRPRPIGWSGLCAAIALAAGVFCAPVLAQPTPPEPQGGPLDVQTRLRKNGLPISIAQLRTYAVNVNTARPTLQSAALLGDAPALQRLLDAQGATPGASGDEDRRRALLLATLAHKDDAATLLRQRGAPVDVFISAASGDIEDVRKRLDADPTLLNAHDPLIQRSVLCWAIATIHSDVARMLVERGAAVNERTTRAATLQPLVEPAEQAAGANKSPDGQEIETPLLVAIRVGSREYGAGAPDQGLINQLLEKGADANTRCPGGPPLVLAVSAGNVPLIEALVAHKADVNGKDAGGFPVLCRAVNSKALTKRLLELGASPNARAPGENTILDMAAADPKTGAADELLAHGARLTFTSACILGKVDFVRDTVKTSPALVTKEVNHDTQETPIFLAARFGQVEVAKLLLDGGARLEKPNRAGLLPLHVAAGAGQAPFVQLLLDRGSKLTTDSPEGTPLHVAAAHGQAAVVKLLLDKGAKVNGESERTGYTPLAASCRDDQPETAALLLERGADINFRGRNARQTALHAAASSAAVKAVKLLLSKGADAKLLDAHNHTALDCAKAGAFLEPGRNAAARQEVILLLSEPAAK